MEPFIIIVIVAFVIFVTILALISRYKRCPSDKILVIYGRTGGQSAKCIHGGGAFIWPVIQDFAYLDLKPISIEANLTNALSRQNIRVDVPGSNNQTQLTEKNIFRKFLNLFWSKS